MSTSAKDEPTEGRGLKTRLMGWKDAIATSHAARTLKRYGTNGGNVLSGGIAYFSLTSIAAGLVILATVSAIVIGNDEQAQDAVIDFIDDAVPGVVSANGEGSLIDEDSLEPTAVSGIVGIIAFFVLLFTATRYIGGLRQGVKAMLGGEVATGVTGKLRDFMALAALAVLLILGAALQVLASEAAEFFADLFDSERLSAWALRGSAIGVVLLVDAIFVYIAIKVLGRAERSLRELWPVLLITAALMGALRLGSTFIISSASENPVLGPFAAVITILIFADFVARIILFGAAWLGTEMKSHIDEPRPEMAEGEPDEAGGPVPEGAAKAQRA